MQQLETNAKEMDTMCDELRAFEDNLEDEYNSFSQNLNSKRRQEQEENAKDALKNAKSIDEARKIAAEREAAEAAASAAVLADPQKILNDPKNALNSIIKQINTKVIQPVQPVNQLSLSVTIDPKASAKAGTAAKSPKPSSAATPLNDQALLNDDELNKFLASDFATTTRSESNHRLDSQTVPKLDEEDDDDDDDEDGVGANPMVAKFVETVDVSDDDSTARKMKKSSTQEKKLNKPVVKAVELR